MAQTAAFIDIVKQSLKSHNLTYADVGQKLNMSEANVKRQFAAKRFTLDRLESICKIMDMELSDLFQLYEESRQRITQLSIEQEQGLVKDRKLLAVAVGVRNRLSFVELREQYQLSETECVQYLAQLDRLKVIDLLPNNRIKLRIAEDFSWLPDGPIERFFETTLQNPFLKSHFKGKNEQRLFLHGLVSDSSIQQLTNKMRSLAKEFSEILRQDSSLSLDQRHPVGFILAMRPWDEELDRIITNSTSKKSQKSR